MVIGDGRVGKEVFEERCGSSVMVVIVVSCNVRARADGCDEQKRIKWSLSPLVSRRAPPSSVRVVCR